MINLLKLHLQDTSLLECTVISISVTKTRSKHRKSTSGHIVEDHWSWFLRHLVTELTLLYKNLYKRKSFNSKSKPQFLQKHTWMLTSPQKYMVQRS